MSGGVANSGSATNGSENIFSRPTQGWLHNEAQLAPNKGVIYTARFGGYVQVHISMKSIDFKIRSELAKECIDSVYKAYYSPKIQQSKTYAKYHGKPIMQHRGSDIYIKITTDSITLTKLDNSEVIFKHDLLYISFASSVEIDNVDYVCYVAKGGPNSQSDSNDRACYVIECHSGTVSAIIATIGQAFEARFIECSKDSNSNKPIQQPLQQRPLVDLNSRSNAPIPASQALSPDSTPDDDYITPSSNPAPQPKNHPVGLDHRRRSSSNSIQAYSSVKREASSTPRPSISSNTSAYIFVASNKDHRVTPVPPIVTANCRMPPWLHTRLTRVDAEKLLYKDGDFIVRVSTGPPVYPTNGGPSISQYVLSGRNAGHCRHLLLVDPDGKVRTKDKEFENIEHLLNYHIDNGLPIISRDGDLYLRNHVPSNLFD